jgi:site-specific recombinase XerC
MATEGSVYQRKDGRWVAQYRDAKDKVRYLYRKTKAEAKKALREALQDRDEGFVPADKLTVGLYLDEWMDERRNTVSARTWRVQESMIGNRVKPGTIRIERTLHNGECTAPKTHSSRRTLTLPQRALEALVRLSEVNGTSGYLFATSSGKPVDVSNFYKWSWRPALRRADLPETLTPHQLRHGTASLLLNQNVPVPMVSRYLGHANPGITMKIYAHMIGDFSGMTASGIDEALG